MRNHDADPAERGSARFEALHRLQDRAIQSARRPARPDFAGAGIVIVAGGARCFTNAYVALTHLREVVGSRLPVQLWYLGPDEMSPEMLRIVARFDVEPVDALAVRRRYPVRRLGGWECKAYALLRSPFRHVVLLDADNVPLVDPAALLCLPEYAETGAIFWPDNQSQPRDSPVWDLFRVPYREELEVESGQLLVDKARCWVPLNLALHYNEWSDVYYRYVYGDKETFHFAWRRLGQPYAMPAGRPRLVYCQRETPTGRRRMTAALEQRDFAGHPVFHHRTGAEWVLYGENAVTECADLDARALATLAELRRQWNGRVHLDPPIPPGVDGRDVVATRFFRYRRIGVEERLLELEPNERIGLGAAASERTWRFDAAASETLVIAGDDGDTCRLVMAEDGIWRGAWPWYERVPVELVPLGDRSFVK